jgi:hypothetical protein
MSDLRPFVAWDGEGVNNEDPANEDHPYSLFGSSLGWRVKQYNLTTLDCLSLMLETELACPEAIHFGFAFGYDVNMILRQLPLPQLMMLRAQNRTRFQGFDLEYIPKKWFRVSYGRKGHRTTVQLFDVFSFFAAGLGKVLRTYSVGTEEQLARIDAGKGERPDFRYEHITTDIEPYWETELDLMVRLMDKFRKLLYDAGLFITSWHGPGAIASYLLRTHHVEEIMDRGPSDAVLEAARSAYFGGRFQPFTAGYYEGPVYSADINSAYPYSHSRLPNLRTGKWEPILGRPGSNPADIRLGMYKIRYNGQYSGKAMPLPHRDKDGSVSFPSVTEGWFHAAEAGMVYNDPNAEFLEGLVFQDDGSSPFAWIEDIYEERLKVQDKYGKAAAAGFRLGPNSLYGQVAQRAGWERRKGPPKWHQLEWAGAITSECRSLVYYVARTVGNGLVSIDTDGVLSLRPFPRLPNGIGRKLGQWHVTEYTGMLYLQNGIYWLRDENGDWLPPKSRGIPRKKLDFDTVFPLISQNKPLEVNQHMFIGYGLALRGRMHDWRKWKDEPRTITFGGTGKSIHIPRNCGSCRRGFGYTEALHTLTPVPPKMVESTPHYLPWLDKGAGEFPVRQEIMELERWGHFE